LRSFVISRRRFLTLPLAFLLGPLARAAAEGQARKGSYSAEVGLLYDTLTFRLEGTTYEWVDLAAGRYEVRLVGEGVGIANRIESTGRRHQGRWVPVRTVSRFDVRGRESRSEVVYDHDAGLISYHYRGETFFLRRVRAVDDTIAIPAGVHVDDVISAEMNFADGYWKPDGDGTYRTWVVRRRRKDNEGPDEVDPNARAEIAPFALNVVPDPTTGKPMALFDMSRFSSWARAGRPARIVFGSTRRPELISSSLILGTSLSIRLRDG
jgi:hypothetical protein